MLVKVIATEVLDTWNETNTMTSWRKIPQVNHWEQKQAKNVHSEEERQGKNALTLLLKFTSHIISIHY